ncbi:hypothetical protein GR257_33040 [Rhizobium leguminosarum]|uniref:Uncharacterized protein n=1 Tax=Rhizobium leguminosarum TaxID=384 RepID=A0A7K3VRW5_RHILE|nr:hypothetical protein [Rhizobium leguminosarum]
MRGKAGHVPAFSFADYSVSCRGSSADKPTAYVRANPLRSGAFTQRQPLIRLPPPSPRRRGEGICGGPLRPPAYLSQGTSPRPVYGERVRVRGSLRCEPDSIGTSSRKSRSFE